MNRSVASKAEASPVIGVFQSVASALQRETRPSAEAVR